MRVEVAFANERLALEVPPGSFFEVWEGPEGRPDVEIGRLVEAALESPSDFPPLRQAVVPGDRVAIVLDSDIPAPLSILTPIIHTLHRAGVESESIHIVVTRELETLSANDVAPCSISVHDPDARDQIAYLAATPSGRRIYLNRELTDADFVLPIGLLGFAGDAGFRGPWSALFPSMSDAATMRATASGATVDESEEVSWLLGSQFHIGVLGGLSGVLKIVVGQQDAVRREGIRAVEEAWKFQPSRSSELVVLGVGGPNRPGDLTDIAAALASARRVVRHGGKIVVLSRARGTVGPAMRRLASLDNPRTALQNLRGLEAEPDDVAAKQVADAVAWADVYLLSDLGEELTEDLAMIALGKPEEARRLVTTAESALFIGAADRARVASPPSNE